MATIVPGTASSNLTTTIGSTSAGDTIIMQDMAVAFTSGLDLSGTEYEAFYVAPTCTSSFGSASSGAVTLDLDGGTYTGYLEYNGRGNVAYFTPGATIVETKIINTGSGTFYGQGGTWTTLSQGAGRSQFNDTADVVTAYIMGGSCTIDTHASQTLDTAIVGAGASLICKRNFGALTAHGSVTMPERSPTCTTLNLMPGARVVWNGGNITTVNAYGGRLDLSGISQNITIGTLNNYASGSDWYVKPAGGFTETVTTENLYAGAVSVK